MWAMGMRELLPLSIVAFGLGACSGGGGEAPARVSIPAGVLQMGCGEGSAEACLASGSDALPVHAVSVPAYQIDRFETTVAAYSACVEAGGCEAPGFDSRYCNWGKPGREQHPMNCLDWDHARAFCAWDGGRLCTEAEWERAARGTDGRKWPWGDAEPTCERAVMMDEDGVTYGCGTDSTMPVGSRPAGASAEGVQDLAGNVWEWVEDTYVGDTDPAYDGAPVDGSAWVDPAFTDRVVRGGSFVNVARFLVSWHRYDFDHSNGFAYYLGWRCCR
jgi:formylglycine-generating enzyme required for sulfatase activity